MMNRYIAALLVVLAATGIETHSYQSAIKFALTDISYEEFIKQPEAKALKEDILAFIKAIKKAQGQSSTHETMPDVMGKAPLAESCLSCTMPFVERITRTTSFSILLANGHKSCIVIRGPNAC